MENREYVWKLLSLTDDKRKEKVADFVCGMIRKLEKYGEDDDRLEQKLYELAEGTVLTENRARELIKNMKPTGMKWELADTEGVRTAAGYEDIRPVDFWIVMNSAYNDYHDLFNENIEYYQRFSYDFIKDEDAVEDKVYYYYTMMPKKDSK